MAGSHGQEGSSMYHCIDESLEQVKSSGECEYVHHLYTVDTDLSSLLHEVMNLSMVIMNSLVKHAQSDN